MSDIDTVAVDSLKVLDPNGPIREADIRRAPTGLVLEIEIPERLPGGVLHAMKHASLCSLSVQDGGKRRMKNDSAISALRRKRRSAMLRRRVAKGH